MKETRKFDLDDINIIPAVITSVNSRKECKISTEWKTLPLIASPMDTVVCIENYHRYINLDIIPCIPRGKRIPISARNSITSNLTFQSFGISEIEDQLDSEEVHPDDFTKHKNVLIDIANGHMDRLLTLVKRIKTSYPYINLMVGNVAHPKTYQKLAEAGADFIRLSIGTGAGCFIGDTEIITSTGTKHIKDINIGDSVLSHTGNYNEVYNIISYVEDQELIKINDNISTTDHKYWVVDKKYEKIINDDNIHEYAEWIEASKLSSDKYYLIEHDLKE